MQQVFSKEWFNNPKTQQKLLWLLNHSRYFRQDMAIQDHDLPFKEKIVRIEPNSFTWRTGENEFMTDFRTHNKFGKRLYYGFYPIWNLAHKFDMSVANKWIPKANLGFDTLTKYPDASSGGTTVDGRLFFTTGDDTWSGRRDAVSCDLAQAAATGGAFMGISTSTTAGRYSGITRTIYTLDTSALTADAVISATAFSVYGTGKVNTWVSASFSSDIYTSSPADDNNVVVGDFDSLGTISQTGAPIAYADFSATGYNAHNFNATGIENVSKTGITRLGGREALHDAPNSAPTWESGKNCQVNVSFADETGTSQDPKLVVTYSVSGGGATPHNLLLMGIG